MAVRPREGAVPRERRRDPRAEPDDPIERLDALAVDHLGAQPAPSPAEKPAEPSPPAEPVAAAVPGPAPAEPAPEASPWRDLEPVVARGDWHGLRALLEAREGGAESLQGSLGLLHAVALKETDGDAAQSRLNERAIACMATLLGVPADSSVALVLTKRLLRQNPRAWRQRPAPRAGVSVIIVVFAVLVGAAIGYAVTFGPLSGAFRGRSQRVLVPLP